MNNFKEEGFILTHGFRDFNPQTLAHGKSGLMVRQNIMAMGACEEEAAHFRVSRH
jgi:hypothetical protein